MMQTFDSARLDAFVRLLARPYPPDLPVGSHVVRCEGDPDRRATRLIPILMAWLQQRHIDVDIEEALAPATPTRKRREFRASPGLRLLRPTGTG